MRGKRVQQRQQRRRWRWVLWALALLFLGTSVTGAIHLVMLWGEYSAGAAAYEALSGYVQHAAATMPPTQAGESAPPGPEAPPLPAEAVEAPPRSAPEVDFAALAAIDPNVVGWLTIDGTGIDYPVVQGEDNAYYLDHLFTGEHNRAGCLFLDCAAAADFSGPNSVVYGHYLQDGTMFSPLLQYKEQAYFDAHPTGWLVTPEGSYEVRFFSGFVSDVWGEAWAARPGEGWLEEMGEKSLFSGGPTPRPGERILTLSTCSYEFSNARFVLLGSLHPVDQK